jgi:Peptidase family M1 domain/Bacterial Ig-like domain/Secretion system C-terminal sorting domain
MKSTLFTTILLFISLSLFAQETTDKHLCSHHKSMERIIQAHQRLNFSQGLYNLMELYDVKQYHINLNVETNTTMISGNVKFYAQARNNISTFAFELHQNYTVSAVEVKGITYNTASIIRNNNEARVNLAAAINQNELFEAIIYYSGNGPVNNTNIDAGFCQRTAPNGKKYTYTMSEPYGSADWMPIKQILSDKVDSLKVYITTSNANKVGSQGVLKNVVNVGGGKSRHEWESKYPIAYYLISFAVGEYVEHNINANVSGTNTPIISYVYDNATLTANQASLDQTKLTLERFSQAFGDYPFKLEKYGHCQVPHDFWLENQTMSAMPSFPNAIVAHELAHQWYGNAMSLKSFSEIGLSEGFANYSEYLYREYFTSLSSAQSLYRSWVSNITSQPGGSVYLVDSLNTTAMFDSRLTYQKGGSLIHMIRYLINNDTQFYQALKTYTAQFQHKTVTYNDFADVINTVTGVNLKQSFLPQWYRGEGYPTYNITWNWKDGYLHIISNQTTSKPSVTPFFKMPFELAVTDVNNTTTVIRLDQNTNKQVHKIAMPIAINNIAFDPRVFLVAKSTLSRDNSLIIDSQAPKIINLKPSNQATDVAVDANLEITFDENIFKKEGSISIKKYSDGSLVQNFNIQSSLGISVSGNKIILNPANNLNYEEKYYVEVGNSIVMDRIDNVFNEGFTDKNVWSFNTTKDPINALDDEYNNISIYPNPVKEVLYLKSNQLIESLRILNTLGGVVSEFKNPQMEINISNIPQGIYYVKILMKDKKEKVVKLIKQS